MSKNDDSEKIGKIIRLKRFEKPRDGYFEDFLKEFQERRAEEIPKKSSLALFSDRLFAKLRDLGSMKWIAGAGVAYASLMAVILLWPPGPGTQPDLDRAPATYEPAKVPVVPPVEKEDEGELKEF